MRSSVTVAALLLLIPLSTGNLAAQVQDEDVSYGDRGLVELNINPVLEAVDNGSPASRAQHGDDVSGLYLARVSVILSQPFAPPRKDSLQFLKNPFRLAHRVVDEVGYEAYDIALTGNDGERDDGMKLTVSKKTWYDLILAEENKTEYGLGLIDPFRRLRDRSAELKVQAGKGIFLAGEIGKQTELGRDDAFYPTVFEAFPLRSEFKGTDHRYRGGLELTQGPVTFKIEHNYQDLEDRDTAFITETQLGSNPTNPRELRAFFEAGIRKGEVHRTLATGQWGIREFWIIGKYVRIHRDYTSVIDRQVVDTNAGGSERREITHAQVDTESTAHLGYADLNYLWSQQVSLVLRFSKQWEETVALGIEERTEDSPFGQPDTTEFRSRGERKREENRGSVRIDYKPLGTLKVYLKAGLFDRDFDITKGSERWYGDRGAHQLGKSLESGFSFSSPGWAEEVSSEGWAVGGKYERSTLDETLTAITPRAHWLTELTFSRRFKEFTIVSSASRQKVKNDEGVAGVDSRFESRTKELALTGTYTRKRAVYTLGYRLRDVDQEIIFLESSEEGDEPPLSLWFRPDYGSQVLSATAKFAPKKTVELQARFSQFWGKHSNVTRFGLNPSFELGNSCRLNADCSVDLYDEERPEGSLFPQAERDATTWTFRMGINFNRAALLPF